MNLMAPVNSCQIIKIQDVHSYRHTLYILKCTNFFLCFLLKLKNYPTSCQLLSLSIQFAFYSMMQQAAMFQPLVARTSRLTEYQSHCRHHTSRHCRPIHQLQHSGVMWSRTGAVQTGRKGCPPKYILTKVGKKTNKCTLFSNYR